MDVRKRIEDLLDERGWSIYRLAQEASMSWSTLRNIMKKGTEPGIATLESICKAFGISLAQFFDADTPLSITAEQQQLLKEWSLLDQKDQTALRTIIQSLLQRKTPPCNRESLFKSFPK